MDKLKQYLYYIIIGIISFIALFFLPMVGSQLDAAWTLPNTSSGWLVYISSKAIVALLNILIFHCFQLQAKLNVKDNENYKSARAILIDEQKKEMLPRAPQKWKRQQYGRKATTIFLGSALGTVALTQAILSFDYIALITYLFVIVCGLIFGILQMKYAEEYWTNEYYEYALYLQKQNKITNQPINKPTPDEIVTPKENTQE